MHENRSISKRDAHNWSVGHGAMALLAVAEVLLNTTQLERSWFNLVAAMFVYPDGVMKPSEGFYSSVSVVQSE
jgi:hypothetical protein